jgi:flagellar hook-length control protein FliK
MKIAAALTVPVPEPAEPPRVPDGDPGAFLRAWSDLAGRAVAGSGREDLRGTGSEGADGTRRAGLPDPVQPEPVTGAGEPGPDLLAVPVPDNRVALSELPVAAVRAASPHPRALPDVPTTAIVPARHTGTGCPPQAGLPQADMPAQAAGDGPYAPPLPPSVRVGDGWERGPEGAGPPPLAGPAANTAAVRGAVSGLPKSSEPSSADPAATDRAVPTQIAPPRHLTHGAALGPAAASTHAADADAVAAAPIPGTVAVASGPVAALAGGADATPAGSDLPARTIAPLPVRHDNAPVSHALPPEHPQATASPGAHTSGPVAAASGPAGALPLVLSVPQAPGPDALPSAPPAPGAQDLADLAAQPLPRTLPPAAGGAAVGIPRTDEVPPRGAEAPVLALSRTRPEGPPARSAADVPPGTNAPQPAVPDAWPLVLARVAGVHARRPAAEPQPEAALPSARGFAGELPEAVRTIAARPGALPETAALPPDPAARSAVGAFAAPLSAFAPVAGRPETGPALLAAPSLPEFGAALPASAAVPNASPLRSDDYGPARQADAPPARQIAEAVRAAPGNRVDLTLMPEELGRVTISFREDGEALRVHLTADRPETLDLLRRHAPELAAELRAQGYDSPSFFFGRSGRPPPGYAAAGASAEPDLPVTPDSAPPAPRPLPADAIGTLDLRL